jgi:ribonuclease E
MRDEPRGTSSQPREFEAAGVNGEHSEFPDEAGGAEDMQASEGDMEGGGEREAFGGTEGRQDEQGARRRRRGRRGGRRGRDRGGRPQEARQEGEAPEGGFAEDSNVQPLERESRPQRDQPSARREEPDTPVAPEKPASARADHEPQPVAEEAAAPTRSRARARNTATSGEPKIERVVVKPDQVESSVATDPGVLTSEPTRRGWWQRRLGSE